MGHDAPNITPTALVFGAGGLIGKALADSFSIPRVVRCNNQAECLAAIEAVRDWHTTVIYDLAWHGSRTAEERDDAQMQWEALVDFRSRVSHARRAGCQRYISLGSWAEMWYGENRKVWFTDWELDDRCPNNHYARCKVSARDALLATNMNPLWIVFSGLIHEDLPDDSLLRLGALGYAVVDPTNTWAPLPLDTLILALQSVWVRPAGVVGLCGPEIYMTELVKATGSKPTLRYEPPYVGCRMTMQHFGKLVNKHAPRERILAMCAELGEKWRAM